MKQIITQKTSTFFLLGIGCLITFYSLFTLLQNQTIYENSLGKISQNYEQTEIGNKVQITKVSKPFLDIKNENFKHWDATIYQSIKEHMYSSEGPYHQVRGAFFPLFPLLWKITGLNNIGIAILNYIIFILSIGLLIKFLFKGPVEESNILFLILITFPSVVIFYIPYSESTFLITMTITTIGIIRKNYTLYFIGACLVALVRPASIFIPFGIFLIELIRFISHRNIKFFISENLKKLVPFGIGIFLAFFIQYSYTNSWSTVLEAQKHWTGMSFSLPDKLIDWSVEGFALSTFAICFICLPAFVHILYRVINHKKYSNHNFNEEEKKFNSRSYLLLLSSIYFVTIFMYKILNSHGSINSLFRYVLSSPMFYISVILLIDQLNERRYIKRVLIPSSLILTIVFLNLIEYGGDRSNFSYAGLYLAITTVIFLLYKNSARLKFQYIITGVLVSLNLVWTGYLLNMYISEGWLFT